MSTIHYIAGTSYPTLEEAEATRQAFLDTLVTDKLAFFKVACFEDNIVADYHEGCPVYIIRNMVTETNDVVLLADLQSTLGQLTVGYKAMRSPTIITEAEYLTEMAAMSLEEDNLQNE